MSHHRGNGRLCVPIQQSPSNGFRVKCPVRGFVLARDLATKCGYAGYCENTRVTILGNSAKFGLGCLAGLCSTARVRSMRSEIMRHFTQLAILLHDSKGRKTGRCVN